jgi:hypothetical protein
MHLIRSAYHALPPGGALVAIEALIDDCRRITSDAALMQTCVEIGHCSWGIPDHVKFDQKPYPQLMFVPDFERIRKNSCRRKSHRVRDLMEFTFDKWPLRR